MTPLGRLAIARQCLGLILCNTTPGGQQVGVVVQPPVQPRLGGLAIFPRGRRFVDGAAPAVFQATPEHIARHQLPALCRNAKPPQRQRLIAFDTAPVQQNLPQQRLGIHHPFLRRDQDRLGGAHRGVIKHALQLLDREHLLATQQKAHIKPQPSDVAGCDKCR